MSANKDTWTVGEWHENGQPHIVRMRAALPVAVDRELLPNLVVVEWRYDGGPSGIPSAEEHERMKRFEDALEAGTESKTPTLQALSLTGGGVKEWRYYTADVDRFMQSLHRDLQGHEKYPIDLRLFQDPEWSALSEYLHAAKPAA